MNQNEKAFKLQNVVESGDARTAGRLVVELLLDADEDTAEIAADFIENEIGRHDWANNWSVIKAKENPLARVQAYLTNYGLVADPRKIVAAIDQMVAETPGRWK